MKYLSKAKALKLLSQWQDRHTVLERVFALLGQAVGVTFDNPLADAAWEMFDGYTQALALALGDHEEWLCWYREQNNFGVNKMTAGYDKKLKPIKNANDLYRLILESRKRHAGD